MNKKLLYKSIMKNVAKEVKKSLNENYIGTNHNINNIDTYEYSLNSSVKNYKALVFAKSVCEPVIKEALSSQFTSATFKNLNLNDDINGLDIVMSFNGKSVSLNAKIFNYKNKCIDLGQKLPAQAVVFIINDYLYIIPSGVAKKLAEDNKLYLNTINKIIEAGSGNSKKYGINEELAMYYNEQFRKYLSYKAINSFIDIAGTSIILQDLYSLKYGKYFQLIGK